MIDGSAEALLYEALIALLHRGTRDSFVLATEPFTQKFVQFGKGPRLTMDMPLVALTVAETLRASRFFRKLGVPFPKAYRNPDSSTGRVDHGPTFVHDFGHDCRAAAHRAMEFFQTVYRFSGGVLLRIDER
jgi:hypothetical protein